MQNPKKLHVSLTLTQYTAVYSEQSRSWLHMVDCVESSYSSSSSLLQTLQLLTLTFASIFGSYTKLASNLIISLQEKHKTPNTANILSGCLCSVYKQLVSNGGTDETFMKRSHINRVFFMPMTEAKPRLNLDKCKTVIIQLAENSI